MNSDEIDINIDATFRITQDAIPTRQKQYECLYMFARLLENAGLNIGQWHPGDAGDSNESLNYRAFTEGGPSQSVLDLAPEDVDARYHTIGVWNGLEGRGGIAFLSKYTGKGISSFKMQSVGVREFHSYTVIADIVEGLTKIWPVQSVEVGPFKYFSQLQTFPNRPGVGWMLYLPHRIEIEQIPEARMLRHVRDVNGRAGTLIISEIDNVFSADDPEQVKVANQIEIRLADQDLLPRYAEL